MNARERLAQLEVQCAQLEYERDKLRAQAEYCWKDRDELQKKLCTAPFFDQFRDLSYEHARVLALLENIRNERDNYKTALEVIAAAVRDPLATWQDLTRVLQDQLQELGFDTTLEDDE